MISDIEEAGCGLYTDTATLHLRDLRVYGFGYPQEVPSQALMEAEGQLCMSNTIKYCEKHRESAPWSPELEAP